MAADSSVLNKVGTEQTSQWDDKDEGSIPTYVPTDSWARRTNDDVYINWVEETHGGHMPAWIGAIWD